MHAKDLRPRAAVAELAACSARHHPHTPRATFLCHASPLAHAPPLSRQPSRPVAEAGRVKVLNCEKAIEEKFETCIDQVEHSERNPSDFTIYASAACLWLVIFGFVLIIFHNF